MFETLKLLIQGKLPDYNQYLKKAVELETAKKRIAELEGKLILREESQKMSIPIAGFDNFLIEPAEPDTRKAYAAQVDEFYNNILNAKIKISIGEIRQLLALASVSPGFEHVPRNQYDFFLRGMEAGLWKINDWAQTLQGELREKQ